MNIIQFNILKRRWAWKAFNVFDQVLDVPYRIIPTEWYGRLESKVTFGLMLWISKHIGR